MRERRGKWKKAVRRRERQMKELFLTHLQDICGTVVRAWRTKLDPENRRVASLVKTSSTVSQGALKRYCSKAAVQLDFVSLWRSLDLDGDGEVGLEALAPAAAETLAGFKQWAMAHYGSCALFWASPMLSELRKAPQRQGRWRSDKKMLLGAFVSALRDAGAIKRGEGSGLLGSSLDSYGCGFVCQEDFVWLDGWRPVEWLTATPNQEEWAIMKALLTRVEGHPLKAWRKRLDKDDSNAVSWVEFRSAFEELGFRGDIAGAWRYADNDMSGCISLKEYDRVSADLLNSFKAWAERFFGSVGRAFAALDSDGSGTVSRHELRKACQKRCWAGDVDMLFNCLDVDEGSGHRATLDVCEVSFLDNWDEGASESEDERPEREPEQAPPSQRSASSSVRPPPRAASPPRSASARAEPARSPILEAAAQNLLRRCPPEREMRPPRPRPKQKDPEQWAQDRERQAKSIYRNLAAAPMPAPVVGRLYEPSHAAAADGGEQRRAWREELRRESALVTRSRSCADVAPRPRRRAPKARSETPPPAYPNDLVYRFGSHGSVVAPFNLFEMSLKPIHGEDFSRGGGDGL